MYEDALKQIALLGTCFILVSCLANSFTLRWRRQVPLKHQLAIQHIPEIYISCVGFAWYLFNLHRYIQKLKHIYLGECYFIYQQPVLVCSDGKFKNFLALHVPILQEKYWPTLWCFESRLQTAFASLLRSIYPNVKYSR